MRTGSKTRALILSLLLASPAISAQAQSLLDRQGLVSLLTQYESFKPRDQFASPYDQSALAGRKFRISMHIGGPGEGSANYGLWSYDNAKQVLTVHGSEAMWFDTLWMYGAPNSSHNGDMPEGLYLSQTVTAKSRYVGSNAYGAHVMIDKTVTKAYGVAFIDNPAQSPFHHSLYVLYADLPMSGDTARQVTKDINMVVEGTLVASEETPAACGGVTSHNPTIDSPEDKTESFCLLFARADRVALEAGPSHQILKEWRRNPQTVPDTDGVSTEAMDDSSGVRISGGQTYPQPTYGSATNSYQEAAYTPTLVVTGAALWTYGNSLPPGRQWATGTFGVIYNEKPVPMGTVEQTAARQAAQHMVESASEDTATLRNISLHQTAHQITTLCADANYGNNRAGRFIAQVVSGKVLAYRLNASDAERQSAGCEATGIRLD